VDSSTFLDTRPGWPDFMAFNRLRRTPADEIRRTRVRVPTAVKLRIAAGALRGGRS